MRISHAVHTWQLFKNFENVPLYTPEQVKVAGLSLHKWHINTSPDAILKYNQTRFQEIKLKFECPTLLENRFFFFAGS